MKPSTKTNIIRYGSQALIMTIGTGAILFFGLMTPVVAFFNPVLAVVWFIVAVTISYGVVSFIDRIDKWADRQEFSDNAAVIYRV